MIALLLTRYFMDFLSPKSLAPTQEFAAVLETMVSGQYLRDAQHYFDDAVCAVPMLAKLRTTPQTPPRHTEGPFVADHVVRMLAIIVAFEQGVSLMHSDAVGTDRAHILALHHAEQIIRESPDMFRAFALMHAIAAPDVLLLVAAEGSAGEAEGFVPASRRQNPTNTGPEIVRFDKLHRAGKAGGIVATFAELDRAVIAPRYAEAREAIVRFCKLENAYVKFVMEVCWSHCDVESFFVTPGNESAFLGFAARAGRAGIHVERFLDTLLGVALLDHDLGRVDESAAAPLAVLHRFVTAEHAAMPERHAIREARQAHAKKVRVKAILAECGLDPETLFAQLGTPLGPERGAVMHAVYAMIRGEGGSGMLGSDADRIQHAAQRAAEMLAQEGLFV